MKQAIYTLAVVLLCAELVIMVLALHAGIAWSLSLASIIALSWMATVGICVWLLIDNSFNARSHFLSGSEVK